jgi:hypothetical protein
MGGIGEVGEIGGIGGMGGMGEPLGLPGSSWGLPAEGGLELGGGSGILVRVRGGITAT